MNAQGEHDLGFACVTQQTMPNREICTGMRLPNGITTTIAQMHDWKWQDGAPVQEGHYHKGLMERCIVLTGWMLYVTSVVPAGYTACVAEKGEMVTFYTNDHHLVLLGPETVIQTTAYGSPVGNPKRKGIDWWPSGEYYNVVRLDELSLDWARECRRIDRHMDCC